jgi:outer membrane receptor protein involved in Fe transport
MFLSILHAKQYRAASLSVQARTALVALSCSPLAALPVAAGALDSSRLPAASTNATINLPPAPLVESTNAIGTNSPITLPPVTVTGDLDRARDQIAPSLGAVTYTIGPNQIQVLPQGQNAPFSQVLLRAPGVVADSLGEVHVRGEHGDLTYRVNGVLLPEGLNGFGQELDTRLIKSVTLITGTLPAQFGFRTAGIVDVTTKNGSQLNGGEFSLYGGGYDTFQPSLQLGGTSAKLDYFVTASYKHNDLGIENPTSSVFPLHDTTDQEKVFAYLSYRLDETSRLSLLLNGSYADFELPNTPDLPERFQLAAVPTAESASVNENQNEQNYYAVLAYQKSAGDFSFQASAYTRYGQIHFSPDPVGDLIFQGVAGQVKNSFFANGLQFDGSYALGEHHTVRAGLLADYTVEKLDTDTLVFPVDANRQQTSNQPMEIVDNHGLNGVTAGVYLQDEWRLTEQLTLNYGARYDRFDASFDHEGQLSPRANLVWQINHQTSAHLGYARYFTPPSVQYIAPETIKKFDGTSNAPYNQQDDPTHVERANYFDVGFSRQLTPAWQVTLDAFYKQARNLIDLGQFGSAVILSPFSYSRGTVYGSELSTTYKQGPFSAFANFSFVATSARDINSAQFEFPNDELAYIQTHDVQLDHEGRYTVSAGASYTWEKNTRFYVDALYGYGLRKGFANTEKLPDYYPVNLGVEHVFRTKFAGIREVKLRFDCINVFDEVYRLRDGSGLGISASQYGQRRTFLAGLSVLW